MTDENVVNMMQKKRPLPVDSKTNNNVLSKRARVAFNNSSATKSTTTTTSTSTVAPLGTSKMIRNHHQDSTPRQGVAAAVSVANRPTTVDVAKPSTKPTSTKGPSWFGIVRISDISCPPSPTTTTTTTSSPHSDSIVSVFPGAILGRDSNLTTSAFSKAKVPLGIDAESAPGVSRKQLQVTEMTKDVVKVHQHEDALNGVGICRYSAETRTMQDTLLMSKRDTVTLRHGDVIIFDFCRASVQQGTASPAGPPKHIFRVVSTLPRLAPSSNHIASPVMPTAAARSNHVTAVMANKKKGSASSAATKRVRNLASPGRFDNPKRKVSPTTCSATKQRITSSTKPSTSTPSPPAPAVASPLLTGAPKTTAPVQETTRSAPTTTNDKPPCAKPSDNMDQTTMPPKSSKTASRRLSNPTKPILDIIQTDASPSSASVAKGKRLLDTFDNVVQAAAAPVAATVAAPPPPSSVAVKKSERRASLGKTSAAPAAATAAVKTVPGAAPGDRVRVFYHYAEDVFGQRRNAGGWYLGTVKKVMKNRIEVTFDDFSVKSIKYPLEDVQLVFARPNESVFYSYFGEPNQTFAYDANPTDLRLGDLVFGLYQNGASGGARFRGRVALVDEVHHTVDVAYDDGEYECNIPVANGNLYLCLRGEDDTTWMKDITFDATIDGKLQEARITQTGPEGITVKFQGEDDPSVLSYREIVEQLMAFAKAKAQKNSKVLDWPAQKFMGNFKPLENPSEPSNEENDMRTRSTDYSLPSVTDERGSAKLTSLFNLLEDEESIELEPLVCPHLCDDTDGERTSNTAVYQEMEPSIAQALWNAVNSKEAFFGCELLNIAPNLTKEMPGTKVLRNLIALVCFGPMFNKTSPYPDGAKVGLAFEYLKRLVSNPDSAAKLAASASPKYWMDCLCQATKATLCEFGDENLVTTAAFRRVGNSFQVSANCEELFADLLEFQLEKSKTDQDALHQKTYRSKPIINPMLENCNGTRQLLKMFTRATAHVLIRYGHHVLGTMNVPLDTEAMHCSQHFCHAQAARLASALGRICVNLAWLHSAESDSDGIFLAQDCANLMQEAFDAEWLEANFDASPFLDLPKAKAAAEKLKAKHWQRVKLHFVTSLKGPRAEELRSCLAQRLDICDAYEICYSDKNL